MEELRNAYRRTAIIGGAMLASIFVYAAVAAVLQSTAESFEGLSPGELAEVVRNLLLVVALGAVVAAQLIRNRLSRTERPRPVTSPTSAPPAEDRVQKLVTGFIVIFALVESVAIFGLVVFLLYGNILDFFVLWLISLVSFAVFFPRYSRWEEWMKRQNLGV